MARVARTREKKMNNTSEKIKRWGQMHFESDPLYSAYHEHHNNSIWRRLSPCLHHWSPDQCPLGRKCGFPTEEQVKSLYQEGDEVSSVALENYKEIERMLGEIVERMTERKKSEKRVNHKLLALPLERFLVQYKITLKRELCKNKYCSSKVEEEEEKCDKAHSMRELFVQFDQTFLKEFYSHHFLTEVRPVLPKKSDIKIEFSCHKCKSVYWQHSALVLLESLDGKLIEPRISRTCLYCSAVTHFLVYFKD